MSQENVELTAQYYDALNRRDLNSFLTAMNSNVAGVFADCATLLRGLR